MRRALLGQAGSSIKTQEGVLSPLVFIASGSPVRNTDRTIVGATLVGLTVDNALLDGIKKATGLESSIYAGNTRSATTLSAADGQTRWIGIKEENQEIKKTVLEQNQTFRGPLNLLNRPFLGVFAPLSDADNAVVGMLFVGTPSIQLLAAAARSIEITLVLAVLLLILSILPVYKIAKYLAKQLR